MYTAFTDGTATADLHESRDRTNLSAMNHPYLGAKQHLCSMASFCQHARFRQASQHSGQLHLPGESYSTATYCRELHITTCMGLYITAHPHPTFRPYRMDTTQGRKPLSEHREAAVGPAATWHLLTINRSLVLTYYMLGKAERVGSQPWGSACHFHG